MQQITYFLPPFQQIEIQTSFSHRLMTSAGRLRIVLLAYISFFTKSKRLKAVALIFFRSTAVVERMERR